jgi:hypothetical protein
MRYNFDDYGDVCDKTYDEKQLEKRLDGAQEFFIALYEELASDKPMNLSVVYNCMSEIAGYLKIDERQFGDLNISRESKIVQFAGV